MVFGRYVLAFHRPHTTSPSAATTITPIATAPQGRNYKHQLTQPIMNEAQDNITIIVEWVTKLRHLLASGVKPEYGKVFKP